MAFMTGQTKANREEIKKVTSLRGKTAQRLQQLGGDSSDGGIDSEEAKTEVSQAAVTKRIRQTCVSITYFSHSSCSTWAASTAFQDALLERH